MVDENTPLTKKQKPFAEYILRGESGANAARLAQYKGNADTLAAVAYENLRKPHIAKYIRDRMKDMVLDTNEALFNLSKLAKIANVGDFISMKEIYSIDMDGKSWLTGVVADFDIEKFNKAGYGHLIKSIKNTSNGPSIELRDPESANVWIGKHHGAFTEKKDINITGEIEHKHNEEERGRTISTLADALRGAISGKS